MFTCEQRFVNRGRHTITSFSIVLCLVNTIDYSPSLSTIQPHHYHKYWKYGRCLANLTCLSAQGIICPCYSTCVMHRTQVPQN